MSDDPQEQRSRGRPRKFGRRQNFNFRLTDDLRTLLVESASKAGRSMSEEIEFRVNRAFEYERTLGDVEAFNAEIANMRVQWEQGKRQTEEAQRVRDGWVKVLTTDPNVPGGVRPVWLPPGSHNLTNWVDPNAASPAAATLPPVIQEAITREVRSAITEALEEAGLLPKKKSA